MQITLNMDVIYNNSTDCLSSILPSFAAMNMLIALVFR